MGWTYAGIQPLTFTTENNHILWTQGGIAMPGGPSGDPDTNDLVKLYYNDLYIGGLAWADEEYAGSSVDLYGIEDGTANSVLLFTNLAGIPDKYGSYHHPFTNSVAEWRVGGLLQHSGTYGVKVVAHGRYDAISIWTQRFFYIHEDRAPLCKITVKVHPAASSNCVTVEPRGCAKYLFPDGEEYKWVASEITVQVERWCTLVNGAYVHADSRLLQGWTGVDWAEVIDPNHISASSYTFIDGDEVIMANYALAISVEVDPLSTNVPANASSGRTLAVAANVSWAAETNAPWLQITSGFSGVTNGTVTYSVAENAGAARTGAIVVSGGDLSRTCTVSQAGADGGRPGSSGMLRILSTGPTYFLDIQPSGLVVWSNTTPGSSGRIQVVSSVVPGWTDVHSFTATDRVMNTTMWQTD